MALTRKILILMAISVCAALAPASAGEANLDVEKTLGRSIRSLGAQTEFPRERRAIAEDSSWKFEISSRTATILLIIAIAIFLAMFILTWYGNLKDMPQAGRAHDDDPTGERAAAVQTRMEAVRGEADTLAGQGRYAEAMHVLLLQSLSEMRLRLRVPISVALTSREILQRIALELEAHDALADIIGRVEISYFGSHDPGEAEYALCRASYATLIGLLGRRAPT